MHVFLGTLITDDIGLAKQENKNPQAARIHNNVVRRIRQNFQVPSFENQSFPAILFFFFFFFFFFFCFFFVCFLLFFLFN